MALHPTSRERLRGVLAAALVQAAIGFALIEGLIVHNRAAPSTDLQLFGIAPEPPPPPKIVPEPQHSRRAAGKASPPNLRSKASEVLAVPQPIPLPAPTMAAAPKPLVGPNTTTGASDRPGPGTGAGGQGNGTGSGGSGNGEGGDDTPGPECIFCDLTPRDYPKAAFKAGAQGTVYLRFTVGTNGRVTDCRVTRSSGNADLDNGTCKLIRDRFRYRPARDASGRPVPDTITGSQEWYLYGPDGQRRQD